ncbi:hypothetical protein FQR65_LT09095 [Abscondita terminalis]|nr:hypothetical protein FQR65_LT09095 [Abscondita terminalis]
MGFMLRIILGLALVLTTCQPIKSASSWRIIRQILPEEAPEVSVTENKAILNEPNKDEIINNIINKTISNNGDLKSSVNIPVAHKPKTENQTEKREKDVNNSNLNKEVEEYEYSNEEDFDNKKTVTEAPDIKKTVTFREESARSIDINKYISPEFHNKNQVYTLPISPDTEKYTNLHNDITFSTTSTYDYDKKQKDIETDVKRKLEYIDSEFPSAETEFLSNKHDNENISEILEKPNNDTNTELQYIKYKNITSSYNKIKNKINKETDAETGQTINYSTSYNKSQIYDDTPKDYKNKISTHDEIHEAVYPHKYVTEPVDSKKTHITKDTESVAHVLDQKDLMETKPPSINKTSHQEHLFSNKIESDSIQLQTAKPKISFSYPSTDSTSTTDATTKNIPTTTHEQEHTTSSNNNKEEETTIIISKRGSTKYADTINLSSTTVIPRSTQSRTNNKQNLANKQNHTFEEVVQENQVYPIQVPAPTTSSYSEKTTTMEDTNSLPYHTTDTTPYASVQEITSMLPSETTTQFDTTTTFDTTTEDYQSSANPATTEVDTTTFEHSTNLNLVTSFDVTTTTINPTVEVTTEVYSEIASTTDITETVQLVTNSHVDLTDRFTNGRGFNFSNTHIGSTQSLPDTSSQKSLTTFETDHESTVEIEPTTSDYRENIIIKQSDVVTTTKQPNITKTPKHHEEDKNNFNETNTLETKTSMKVNNATGSVTRTSTSAHIKTTESPLIIPLNISMYDTEPESTTNGQFLENPEENNSGKIAAIVISSIGAVCLVLLAGLLIIMRKRHKRFNYGQRCTPVSLDAYSVDNVSVYNSMRRKGAMRASKRSYGNPAFDDPTSISNVLNFPTLAKFAINASAIASEFEEVPQVTAQTNELPEGCEAKNRYANVIPLPETRVCLSAIEGYPNSDYINANYVTGPKSTKNYYIACQAPMQNTLEDFWRMIWEQQSRVILMLTHLFENGNEKCVDYLPPSEVLDCHRLFGDFQITLKKREVKEKYVISILQLKNMVSNSWREVTHLWYLGWPERGVPSEANSLIAFLIEARSYIKALPPAENGKINGNGNEQQVANGSANVEHYPIVVHCSPGTGRTGTVIACDSAIREFELSRQVDIPKTVYKIRRDRASSVQTKEQYAFIYKVIALYATKLTGGVLDSL